MKIELPSVALLRTPVFSVDTEIEEVWEELKRYIQESSPEFHALLKDVEVQQVHALPPKVGFTLWKYFNRSKFRATPFGNFASFSLVPVINEREGITAVTLKSKPNIYEFIDWTEQEGLETKQPIQFLKSNSTTYVQGDEIRFVKNAGTIFQLSSISYHELVFSVLIFCQQTQPIAAVHALLESLELGESDREDFLEQLVRLQLLLTEQQPNNIGRDYFSRLGYESSVVHRKYRLTERNWVSGGIVRDELTVLGDLANFMFAHLPLAEQPDLKSFKEKFIRRYEHRTMPLLAVLDPEQGIGYGRFEQEADASDFIRELKLLKEKEGSVVPSFRYSALLNFIINRLSSDQVLRLEDFEGLENMKGANLPNTFSALIERVDEHLVLKGLGGVSANALTGRFTLASEEVLAQAKQMVKAEEQANPEILFFDISYQGDRKVDNVNRRESIYSYELPILSWSECDELINLNEVLVTVQGDEVVLISEKHQKRMVPRLASAYNYSRSDLSVFRFLTDLQHQGLQSNLNLDLSRLLPDLDHYPRITFKNVIISPATWLAPKEWESNAELRVWLTDKGLARYFKTKEGDQSLLFSIDNDLDLQAFKFFTSGKERVYLEEVFMPEKHSVEDEFQKAYLGEWVVDLRHTQSNYQPYFGSQQAERSLPIASSFLPGQTWLYYELYCHSARSNEILLTLINSFVSDHQEWIESWFFIRYNDPQDHLRFRIKVKGPTSGSLMDRFNSDLANWVGAQKISDVQLKSYYRELDRYGRERIEDVERWFAQDSSLILSILSQGKTDEELYAFSIALLRSVLNEAMPELTEQLLLLKRMTSAFANEHQLTKAGYKLINQHYRRFQMSSWLEDAGASSTLLESWLRSMVQLVEIFPDLVHMHVNRLFHKDQRSHEMIIYEFLYLDRKQAQYGKHL